MAPPLGYIPPADLDPAALAAHRAAESVLPAFAMPPVPEGVDKVVLTECWKHPRVVQALGYEFPGYHQLTGFCVGAGGGNALATCSFLDVLRRGHTERIVRPDPLRPYGRSREIIGWNYQGEGSTGAAFARAVLEGTPDGLTDGIPRPEVRDGLEFGASVEMRWSAARNNPAGVITEGKKHPVQTVAASLTTSDQVRDAVANGYPCTFANSLYVGRASVQGTPPVCVGRFDGSGGHQTSIQGWWNHPQLGELFLYVNQWTASTYPADPGGGPRCSCWVTRDELERRFNARDRFGNPDVECYPFSSYDGYPAQPDIPQLLDWRI